MKMNSKETEKKQGGSSSAVYECTICLENAKEPVVTKCGHIFCWPCLYSWLESRGSAAKCPNCKNPISKENLIPIYTKEESSTNTNRFDIPKRPQGERSQSPPDEDGHSNFHFNRGFSFGFFPFMGFNFNLNSNSYRQPQTFRSPLEYLPPATRKAVINLLILIAFIYFYLTLH